MKILPVIAALCLLPFRPAHAQEERLSEHALKTFEIFKTIVEVDTSKTMGNTPKVAQYLADAAGRYTSSISDGLGAAWDRGEHNAGAAHPVKGLERYARDGRHKAV